MAVSASSVAQVPASPAAAPDHLRFYRPELDVLRFVAFLSVFTVHAFGGYLHVLRDESILAPIGAYGLPLFFFLSAYLITELLRREKLQTGAIHLRAFYIRRVLRIWPLYFAFLLFGKLLGHFFPPLHVEDTRLFAFLFLLGNWYLARYGSINSPISPLWSISLEEQFYLLWPLAARFGGMRTLAFCSVALLPVSWFAIYLHGHQPAVMGVEFDGTIWCNTLVQFQFFALGALTAILLRGRSIHCPTLLRPLIFATGFAAWFTASWLFRRPRFAPHTPGGILIAGYILIAAGCLLLFFSMLGANPASLPGPLVYLGKISYGLYVFHLLFIIGAWVLFHRLFAHHFAFRDGMLVLFCLSYLVALIPTALLAIASYRWFESPFLRLRKRFTFIPSRAV